MYQLSELVLKSSYTHICWDYDRNIGNLFKQHVACMHTAYLFVSFFNFAFTRQLYVIWVAWHHWLSLDLEKQEGFLWKKSLRLHVSAVGVERDCLSLWIVFGHGSQRVTRIWLHVRWVSCAQGGTWRDHWILWASPTFIRTNRFFSWLSSCGAAGVGRGQGSFPVEFHSPPSLCLLVNFVSAVVPR